MCFRKLSLRIKRILEWLDARTLEFKEDWKAVAVCSEVQATICVVSKGIRAGKNETTALPSRLMRGGPLSVFWDPLLWRALSTHGPTPLFCFVMASRR